MTQTVNERMSERIAAELLDLIGPLQRGLRRRTREGWTLAPLPAAQVDVLRVVVQRGSPTVGEVAAELRLAHNTTSTVVGRLAAAGLLERTADASDRRAVRLAATPAARDRIAAWRDHRQGVLGAAVFASDHTDRQALAAALPALRRLLERLQP